MSHPRLVRFDFCMISDLWLQSPGEPCLGCSLSFYNLSEFCVWDVTYDCRKSLNHSEQWSIVVHSAQLKCQQFQLLCDGNSTLYLKFKNIQPFLRTNQWLNDCRWWMKQSFSIEEYPVLKLPGRTQVLFMGPVTPLSWTFGDACSKF